MAGWTQSSLFRSSEGQEMRKVRPVLKVSLRSLIRRWFHRQVLIWHFKVEKYSVIGE